MRQIDITLKDSKADSFFVLTFDGQQRTNATCVFAIVSTNR